VQHRLDLEAERRVLLAEAVAQHHPAGAGVAQAGEAAFQEQADAGRGVRRVGEHHVEALGQAPRQLDASEAGTKQPAATQRRAVAPR
jgi:hypothetical protein